MTALQRVHHPCVYIQDSVIYYQWLTVEERSKLFNTACVLKYVIMPNVVRNNKIQEIYNFALDLHDHSGLDIKIDLSQSQIPDIWDKLGISEVEIKWLEPPYENHERILDDTLFTKITNYMCLELGLDPAEVSKLSIDASERPKIRYTIIRKKGYSNETDGV